MTTSIIKTPSEIEQHECDLPYISSFDKDRGKREYPHGTLIECDICHKVYRSDHSSSVFHKWEYRAWQTFRAMNKARNAK